MAWNKNKPAANTGMTTSNSQLLENQSAIESGDDTFTQNKVNIKKKASNPASAITDTGQLFTKTDTQVELFYADNTATPVVVQLTQNGALGADDQLLHCGTFKVGADSSTPAVMDQRSVVVASGLYTKSAGMSSWAFNVDSVSPSGSDIEITCTPEAASNDFLVQITPTTFTAAAFVYVDDASKSYTPNIVFTVKNGYSDDVGFYFSVFGAVS